MIVKRRVTTHFVQISNEIVRDRSIPLDAHGMLHYLLSLPNDWEINLRQIEKFWAIGSAKRQRIFRDLADAGWLQYEKLKDDEGNYVGSRWIVADEPGPRPNPNEIDTIEEDGEPLAATKSDPAPESQAPDGSALQGDRERGHAADGPPAGRETGLPPNWPVESRRNSSDEERDSKNTTGEREIEVDGLPPPPFGAMLRIWPRDNINSAFACEKIFHALSDKQKADAHAGMKLYLDDARSKGQTRLCDLRTYLDERRWERFTQRGRIGASFYTTRKGTPQAFRWREHYEREEPTKLRLFDKMMATQGYYTTPSEWPPPKGPAKSEVSSLSDEDAREVMKF